MHRLSALIASAILSACVTIGGQPRTEAGTHDHLPKQLHERQIIVTLSEALRDQWATLTTAIGTDYGLQRTGEFPLTSIRVQCLVYLVPMDRDIESLLPRMVTDPRIDSVQFNRVFEGLQGNYSDHYAGLEYGAIAIRADAAHRHATGKGIKIAVIDTGVDKDHPDLRGRVAQIANFVEGGERSFTQDRHGTGVAGIIAARADDGVGIFGIAPDAELLAAKACWYPAYDAPKALCSSWTLAKAIDFAINAGARVLNLSLNGPADPLLTRLLQAAFERSIVVVAAAKEGQTSPGFPASMASVIAVIASDANGRIRVPSWHAEVSSLAAPGQEILTTAPQEGYDF
ncbi:MAG: S8 family peptidase, partial [Gammaproteobacteria bacterium]